MKFFRISSIIFLFFVVCLGFQTPLFATTVKIPVQGYVVDKSGNPLSGNYEVEFSLFASETGGTALTTATESIAFSNGIFQSTVGVSTSLITGNPQLYLEVVIEGETLSPRMAWNPVPFAVSASFADECSVATTVSSSLFGNGLALGGDGTVHIDTATAFSWTKPQSLAAQNQLRFGDADSSNYVGFQAPSTVSSNLVWTLPASDGSSGQVLSTNGSGTLSWSTISSGSSGTITGVTAGDGMTGGGTTGAVTLNVVAGSGITAAADSIALGPLTADWSQTGAFDLVLNNASSEIKILESTGATFFGILDVGDLSADRTYTFPDETGTVCTTGSICAGYQSATSSLSSSTSWGGDFTGTGSSPTIGTSAVTSAKILDGTIANADVSSSAAIDFSKLATLSSGNILVGNGSNVAASVAMSGDATIANTGAVSIASGTVTSAKILDGTIANADVNASAAIDFSKLAGSSASLAGAVTDETGSGLAVFGTSPTFTTSITDPLVTGGTGTTSTLALRSTSGVGASGSDIIFQTGNNGATEDMRILNNGNVGIGTTSPSYPLVVSGSAGSGATQGVAEFIGGVTDAGLRITNSLSGGATWTLFSSGGGSGQGNGTFSIYDATNSATRMAILSSGRIGVGTTSPSYPFVVSGSAGSGATQGVAEFIGGVTDAGLRITNSLSGGATWTLFSSGGGSGQGNGTFSIYDATNSATRMAITSSGKVGIGTTSPGAVLDVTGHIADSGSAATVGTCGTSPAITGNDTRGVVTLGTGSPTACTVTFAAAYSTAPYCMMTPYGGDTGAVRWYITTSTTTLVMNFSATPTTSQQFHYYCIQ